MAQRSITVSRRLQLTSWTDEVSQRFPDLSGPVASVLALCSFGMVLSGSSGLSSVALSLSKHLHRPEDALRKRLREFCLDAQDKSGTKQGQKRRDFDPADAFAPLLRWILSLWEGKRLHLAIDATNLGDRFHVLCVSVVVRGLAIPVAWKVLRGGVKEAWNPHWVALLGRLKEAVPDDWTVVVSSDRGLESPALFGAIVDLGWHPLMRVKKAGAFRPTGWGKPVPMERLAGRKDVSFAAEGRAYRGEKMPCTLLARWEEGYAEPWLVLTDLPPESADASWYGMRTWIEQGFKVVKGGGWHWDRTRMEDPQRVERLWLAMAVATLWTVAVGVEDEVRQEDGERQRRAERMLRESEEQAETRRRAEQERRARQQEAQQRRQEAGRKRREAKEAKGAAPKKEKAARHAGSGATARQRAHRVSKRGREELMAAWSRGRCPLPQRLHPEAWPMESQPSIALDEKDFLCHQT